MGIFGPALAASGLAAGSAGAAGGAAGLTSLLASGGGGGGGGGAGGGNLLEILKALKVRGGIQGKNFGVGFNAGKQPATLEELLAKLLAGQGGGQGQTAPAQRLGGLRPTQIGGQGQGQGLIRTGPQGNIQPLGPGGLSRGFRV